MYNNIEDVKKELEQLCEEYIDVLKDLKNKNVLSVIGLGINDVIMLILKGILSKFIPTYYYLFSKIVATAIVMVWNFVSRKIFLEEKNQGNENAA